MANLSEKERTKIRKATLKIVPKSIKETACHSLNDLDTLFL